MRSLHQNEDIETEERDENKAGWQPAESASRAAHSVLPVLELTRWGSWTYLPEVDGKLQQFEKRGW